MPELLCIGDVMLDVVAIVKEKINYGSDTPSSISTHGGGAAGNVAAWAKEKGAPTHIVARVGDDAAGIAVLSEFDAAEITHGRVIIKGERTGVVVVLVDKAGERTMFPESGANSALKLSDLPDISSFKIIYLSGYALLNEVSRSEVLAMVKKIRERNIPIFFDPATVGGMKEVDINEVRSWLPLMSGLFMNEEESAFLTGKMDLDSQFAELLRFAPLVVIKRGANGAIGKEREGESVSVPALPASVKDTTGAGDSFAGGYIAKWLKSGTLNQCLQAGATSAAECVAIVGARPHVTPSI